MLNMFFIYIIRDVKYFHVILFNVWEKTYGPRNQLQRECFTKVYETAPVLSFVVHGGNITCHIMSSNSRKCTSQPGLSFSFVVMSSKHFDPRCTSAVQVQHPTLCSSHFQRHAVCRTGMNHQCWTPLLNPQTTISQSAQESVFAAVELTGFPPQNRFWSRPFWIYG